MNEILTTSIIVALCVQAWTWAFPPFAKIRDRIDPWADLPTKATVRDYLKYAAWKLTACSLCSGLWAGLAVGCILFGWEGLLVAVCSSVLSEVLDRVANK